MSVIAVISANPAVTMLDLPTLGQVDFRTSDLPDLGEITSAAVRQDCDDPECGCGWTHQIVLARRAEMRVWAVETLRSGYRRADRVRSYRVEPDGSVLRLLNPLEGGPRLMLPARAVPAGADADTFADHLLGPDLARVAV